MATYLFLNDRTSLGEGGFGAVYPCHRLANDGSVDDDQLAVKICVVGADDDREDKFRRFRNGGRLGKRLRHANVMPIEVTGDHPDSGTPYIVMPLADGGNLDEWLDREDRSEEARVDVFSQVLSAIAFAHSQNILHRDIKSENVLFLAGSPRVADFDLAKDLDPETAATAITETNIGMGTRGYVAPEQCTDLKRVGPPADVYALGRLLWRIFSGRKPPHLSPLDLSLVPAQYRAFIEKASEYRQHDRYGSAGEMLLALHSLIAAPPGSPKQVAQGLAEQWNGDEPQKHWRTLRDLNEHFARNADDEELHYELAPFLPPALLDSWMTEFSGGFADMVSAVDVCSSGSLPWDDCDGFARFYLRIFVSSKDQALRQRSIERVLRIGASHNRFPVAYMLRDVLGRVDNDADAELVANAVRAERDYAAWFVVPEMFPPIIVEAFAAAKESD